jgi:hypothetical protein
MPIDFHPESSSGRLIEFRLKMAVSGRLFDAHILKMLSIPICYFFAGCGQPERKCRDERYEQMFPF